ncbi:hypothetical protein JSO19_00140 [Leucobacter sp. UCMA 4100]|nr:hypothetical protein [Leucobacter sp. UCMA 4100]MDA3145787.1 hypothetical protein [Leucobacter sp. UCMA 4100]
MSKQRVPLKSSLAGSSPVTAQAPERAAAAPVEAQPAPQPAPAAESVAKPVAGKKTKVAYYQERAEADRTRGAFQTVGQREGYRTYSDFHAAVMLREVERLEALYNDGKPFESAAPGTGALGRPLD